MSDVKRFSFADAMKDEGKRFILEADHDRVVSELRETIYLLFNQACQYKYDRETDTAYFDHLCISTYEHAQADLLEWGLIKESQCSRT